MAKVTGIGAVFFKSTKDRAALTSVINQSLDLAFAVPQVVAHRLTRLWFAEPLPSTRDRAELQRMVEEKVAAFHESWMAMLLELYRANVDWATRWPVWWLAVASGRMPRALSTHGQRTAIGVFGRGLAPIHRRATANARRLGGRRVRS